jgi:hypothetical protein
MNSKILMLKMWGNQLFVEKHLHILNYNKSGCYSKLEYFIEFRDHNQKPPRPKLTEIIMNKEMFCVLC